MRVLILHQEVGADATTDERDVLVQAAAVRRAMEELGGYEVTTAACSLDLNRLQDDLLSTRPEVVFNLVESLGGSDRLLHLPATILDVLGIRYTGSPALALAATSHKLQAKTRMREHNLPTPDWFAPGDPSFEKGLSPGEFPSTWLAKAVYEHASLGIDDSSVRICASEAELAEHLAAFGKRLGRPVFAERYIAGREFNLSLLAGPSGSEVLPVAEIVFDGFPPDRPRIVGYRAKWEGDSFESLATPRRFSQAAQDAPLRAKLAELSLACWRIFELRGYARVDFRVDDQGRPWILEINANPCLSPDAGFAAAAEQAKIQFREVIGRILAAARSPIAASL